MILVHPHECLSSVCLPVSGDAAETLGKLEQALLGESGQYLGIGLAANQIGILERVCIIRYGQYRMDLVNPRLFPPGSIGLHNEILMEFEGCLSLPNIQKRVPRFAQIHLEADNFSGRIHINNKLLARIIQHEVMHLDGKGIWSLVELGRNDPCLCGSNKKFKKCCGAVR
jgi:peptide deformylase